MSPTERFAALLARPEAELPLDEAALVLAAHGSPGLDVAAELSRIDDLAAASAATDAEGVVRYLFTDAGFAGNQDRYQDPRNSYLNDVLTRRLGIPITLAVVALEVGRRCGVALDGVGMPGHFLVATRERPRRFVDVFDGGRWLQAEDCREMFAARQPPGAVLLGAHLDPVGPHHIIARMLANLRAVFTHQRDRTGQCWVQALCCRLPGAPPEEFLGWAELLSGSGRFDEAASVLEALATEVGGPTSDAWQTRARRLRARLN